MCCVRAMADKNHIWRWRAEPRQAQRFLALRNKLGLAWWGFFSYICPVDFINDIAVNLVSDLISFLVGVLSIYVFSFLKNLVLFKNMNQKTQLSLLKKNPFLSYIGYKSAFKKNLIGYAFA